MALQSGVSSAKVIILVGAGLTGSVMLKSGRLSEVISQLHELLKGVNEAEIMPSRYDAALLAAQIRQLAQEIKDLALSNPVQIFNGTSETGSYANYLVPAAAVGAMGYCYMWWKGWSFSDVMFVTKHNMANAVATVSQQLENVSQALSSTKMHLTKRLENLDWKMEEQKEISSRIANNVDEVTSSLSRIGFDVDLIHQMVSGLELKVELLESKQDVTNSGLWYLCQVAGSTQDGLNAKASQAFKSKLSHVESSLKGLQFITEANDSGESKKSVVQSKEQNFDYFHDEKVSKTKMRIHRSYPVGISFTRDILGSNI